MKKIITLLAIFILLFACAKEQGKDQIKEPADDYPGNYTCTTAMFGDFVITKKDANTILIAENKGLIMTGTVLVNSSNNYYNDLSIEGKLVSGILTAGTATRFGSTKISFAMYNKNTLGVHVNPYSFDIIKK